MLSANYADFKRHIRDDQIPVISRMLAFRIRPIVRDMCGGPQITAQAQLEEFFTQVMRVTGEWTSHEAEDYFHDLIKKWKIARNRSLVVATYYFLHTTRMGQVLAQEVDRAIFGDLTYAEAFGVGVPGGYQDELTSLKSERSEVLDLLKGLHSAQSDNGDKASLELLVSLARLYEEEHPEGAINDVKVYLVEKIEQWKEHNAQLSHIKAEDAHDQRLIAEARAATDKGDFAAANELMAEAERRRDQRTLIPAIETKCEWLSLRASNLSLAGKQVEAASLYDVASDLMKHVNPAASITYAHHAANLIYQRAFHYSDIPLSEAARRFREIIDRAGEEGTTLSWRGAAPLIIYLDILKTMSQRGAVAVQLLEIEHQCRDALDRYCDPNNNEMSAYFKYTLAEIISEQKAHPRYRDRLNEAVSLLREAIALMIGRSFYDLSYRLDLSLGLAFSSIAALELGTRHRRRAIKHLMDLRASTSNSDEPQRPSQVSHNLGSQLVDLGRRTRNPALVREGVGYLKEALTARDRGKWPTYFARTASALADAEHSLSTDFSLPSELERAVEWVKEALSVWSQGNEPINHFHDQLKLAKYLILLAQHSNDSAVAQEAVEVSQALMGVPTDELCSKCSDKKPYLYLVASVCQSNLLGSPVPLQRAVKEFEDFCSASKLNKGKWTLYSYCRLLCESVLAIMIGDLESLSRAVEEVCRDENYSSFVSAPVTLARQFLGMALPKTEVDEDVVKVEVERRTLWSLDLGSIYPALTLERYEITFSDGSKSTPHSFKIFGIDAGIEGESINLVMPAAFFVVNNANPAWFQTSLFFESVHLVNTDGGLYRPVSRDPEGPSGTFGYSHRVTSVSFGARPTTKYVRMLLNIENVLRIRTWMVNTGAEVKLISDRLAGSITV